MLHVCALRGARNMTSKFCREGQYLCRQLHRRSLSVESPLKTSSVTPPSCRTYVSAAAAKVNDEAQEQLRHHGNHIAKSPLGTQAQQKEADRVGHN